MPRLNTKAKAAKKNGLKTALKSNYCESWSVIQGVTVFCQLHHGHAGNHMYGPQKHAGQPTPPNKGCHCGEPHSVVSCTEDCACARSRRCSHQDPPKPSDLAGIVAAKKAEIAPIMAGANSYEKFADQKFALIPQGVSPGGIDLATMAKELENLELGIRISPMAEEVFRPDSDWDEEPEIPMISISLLKGTLKQHGITLEHHGSNWWFGCRKVCRDLIKELVIENGWWSSADLDQCIIAGYNKWQSANSVVVDKNAELAKAMVEVVNGPSLYFKESDDCPLCGSEVEEIQTEPGVQGPLLASTLPITLQPCEHVIDKWMIDNQAKLHLVGVEVGPPLVNAVEAQDIADEYLKAAASEQVKVGPLLESLLKANSLDQFAVPVGMVKDTNGNLIQYEGTPGASVTMGTVKEPSKAVTE